VLEAYLVPAEEIRRHCRAIREADYAAFGAGAAPVPATLPELDESGIHTRVVTVREGAAAAGRTLGELALRQEHGLTAVAVRRAGASFANPGSGFRIEPGDRLVLLGGAAQFGEAAHLFRSFELE